MTANEQTSRRLTDVPASASAPAPASASAGERADLLESLAHHRRLLRLTTRDLTDEQAGRRTTASELCLGGIIKHVTEVERVWAAFIVEGSASMTDFAELTEEERARWADEFRMLPGETLAGVLDDYSEAARRTDELIAALPDLDAAHPLPEAPWFEPGARWSARRAVLHIVGETAQHAGHADIIRESLDGATSMS
ncbi:DinB family protein [Streptomyces yaizuensis]|uniref:DinB family protein n=1 Tax=Streptomyces yaizuensis TaxID=2989713 RepID=A0ABQ5NYP6_9ACTN|nr:DinB family protein [Streptomyces sp. YSPA8]GLF95076.1 DinB family protein [Streptomyces sp. YSPA8]